MAGVLKVPKTEAEYREVYEMMQQLDDEVGDNPNHPLEPLLEIYEVLVEQYEEQEDPELKNLGKDVTPVEVLRHLMDEHGLKQADLKDIFGSQSHVSEVLNKKREMNLNQIKKLSERFAISPALFF